MKTHRKRPSVGLGFLLVLAPLLASTGCSRSKSTPSASAAKEPHVEASAEVASPNTPTPPQGFLPVDRMSNQTGAIDGPGLAGNWYTYSDDTGTVLPLGLATLHKGRTARELSGQGQRTWGAGFGFDLSVGTQPGPSPAKPFDATPYRAIRFDAASRAGAMDILVTVSDVNTNPNGGVCVATSTDPKTQCNGDYAMRAHLAGEGWETHTVVFDDLRRPRWSQLAASMRGFRRDAIYSVHFQVSPVATGRALRRFDILISNVRLLASSAQPSVLSSSSAE